MFCWRKMAALVSQLCCLRKHRTLCFDSRSRWGTCDGRKCHIFICFWVGANNWFPLCTINGKTTSGRVTSAWCVRRQYQGCTQCLLEQLTVTHLVKKLPAFIEPCSGHPSFGSYPEQVRTISWPHTVFLYCPPMHFTIASRPALGPTEHAIQWVPGTLSLAIKWPGREADHSP
jgi:hypothetical protein